MERISHYRLEARLGKGAMGEVWRAVDDRLGRPVALKLLPEARAGQASMQARLLREAQAASALNHPGIVTVHDVGSWHGRTFMVMELVDGEPLSDLARKELPAAEALRLVADAADALAAAHARDILHRDIKGDNLMRTRDGRIKVLDFGLAKLRAQPPADGAGTAAPGVDDSAAVAETLDSSSRSGDEGTQPGDRELLRTLEAHPPAQFPPLAADSASTSMTMPGALVGTPVYMSPEQTDGTPGDPQSEVWSLGVVLYELLAGRRPFDRANIGETLQAIRTQRIAPPSQAAPRRAIPALVDGVVMKALARDRAERYADMRAFAAALRRALRRLSPGHTSGREAVYDEVGRRWLFAPLALVLLAGVAGFGWLLRPRPPAPTPTVAAPPPVLVKGARRLTFEPGCEEYPSFTPDGRALVYDGVAAGDYELLRLDLDSGTSTRLTHAPGWDYAGAVSPDGKWIAYVHMSDAGREIRLLPIAGDAAAAPERLGLSPIGFPAWTADGGVLVGEGDQVVRWDRARGFEERVVATLPPGSAARYVGAFADGDLVALWQTSLASNELVVGEIPRGGRARVIEERLPLDQVGVVIAPSQGAYYYGRHQANANELVRRRFGGGATVVGAITPDGGLSISRDGKRLAYSTCRESGVLARLRPGKPPEELMARGAWRDVWPAPVDARHVAFMSDRAGVMQVWLLDLGTRESRPLAPPESSHPAVSPDGKWVAYVGGAEPGLHVAPAGGGAARRVTDDASDEEPEFASDGRTLVFERTDAAEGARVYAVSLDGGPARPLSPLGALSPAASPSDGRVVYVQPVANGRLLMQTDLQGRAPVPLSPSLPAADWLNPRFSRDGKHLLVVRKTSEVVELDVASGAERVVYAGGLFGISEATYAPDGDGYIASVQVWDGDLWLADGDFR